MAWNEYIHSSPVRWSMVNQHAELIAGNLIAATGDATWLGFQELTGFNPTNNEGVFPINQVLRYATLGEKVPLESVLESRNRFRLAIRRNADGIDKAYLHHVCDVYCTAGGERKVGENEVWMALTRPFHPRDQRAVRELPEIFKVLPESTLEEDAEPLQAPEAFGLLGAEPALHGQTIVPFHVDRTDMYQHVYTVEYYRVSEDALARVLWEQGVDFRSLRFREVRSYFRKPFLLGQVAMAEVYYRADEAAGTFQARVVLRHLDTERQPSERPSVVVALRGVLD